MSGLFTRNVAVLNIDGEHLVYRRDRTIGENNDEIIFRNGERVQPPNENQQSNDNAGNFLYSILIYFHMINMMSVLNFKLKL